MSKSVFSKRYNDFRALLVAARKGASLTQVELAAKLSRPQSFVSKFERGERRLDLVEFLEVARALKLDPTKFVRKLQHRTEDAD